MIRYYDHAVLDKVPAASSPSVSNSVDLDEVPAAFSPSVSNSECIIMIRSVSNGANLD